jgi:hypothetical protein
MKSSNTQSPETEHDEPKAELRKSPLEWAEALGLVRHLRTAPTSHDSKDIPHWSHAAAEALHGWRAHEHHNGGVPMQLTEADYRAALAAVDGPPPPYTPHAAAKSKHSKL